MSNILTCLIVLRFGWTVVPQNGYIHPDEFFQTVEVIAGDALNISVVRTWEFKLPYPLRSVVLPQLTFFPVFKLLKYAEETSSFCLSGYHLITCYRLVMTILSLWIDICIYKICNIIGLKGYTANILFASSYVTLTFQTHTFSNSFEAVLFVTLMLLILICMRRDEENKLTRFGIKFWSEIEEIKNVSGNVSGVDHAGNDNENKNESNLDSSIKVLHKMAFDLRKREKQADLTVKGQQREKQGNKNKENVNRVDSDSQSSVRHQKKMRQQTGMTQPTRLYSFIGLMAITVTTGVFNRPTYAIFTLLPLLWWTAKYPVGENNLFKRTTFFIFTGLVLTIIFVSIDTVYFNDMEISSLFTLDGLRKVFDNYVITPLNFFMYNSMVTNLVAHGHHPFYVHLLVNMPLLFGPMLMYLIKHVLLEVVIVIKALKRSKRLVIEKKLSAKENLAVEEKLKSNLKRAIFPFVIFPAVTLSIFPHQEARFLIPLLPLVVISVVLFCDKLGKIFWTTFILYNILLSVVFGSLHQGGVIPCLLKFQGLLKKEFKSSNAFVTLIFSHTYMPPKHLLLTQPQNLELLDFKGADLQTVFNEIQKCRHPVTNFTNFNGIYRMERIFLVLPGTLVTEFKSKFNNVLRFKSEEKFFPHLSLEDPPDTNFVDSFKTFADLISLYLIEIEK